MKRLLIGLGLVAGAAYLGRRTSSGLSAPDRTYLERALDDVGAFAMTQYPREELRADDDPRFESSDYKMQCRELAPYLGAAQRNGAEAIDSEERGALALPVLLGQAWSAAAQPFGCPDMRAADWLLEP